MDTYISCTTAELTCCGQKSPKHPPLPPRGDLPSIPNRDRAVQKERLMSNIDIRIAHCQSRTDDLVITSDTLYR